MKYKITPIFILILLITIPCAAKERSHWLTGALIGSGVGLGSGIAVGYGACSLSEENTSSCRKTAMPVGAIVGGGIGFGLGALIGSLFKKTPATATITLDPQTGTYGAGMTVQF